MRNPLDPARPGHVRLRLGSVPGTSPHVPATSGLARTPTRLSNTASPNRRDFVTLSDSPEGDVRPWGHPAQPWPRGSS